MAIFQENHTKIPCEEIFPRESKVIVVDPWYNLTKVLDYILNLPKININWNKV